MSGKFWYALMACSCFVGFARAEAPIATALIDGAAVEMFADGFWRYTDAGGERCTPIKGGSVCALPSAWAPRPQTAPSSRVWFRGANYIEGQFTLIQNSSQVGLTIESATRFMIDKVKQQGLRPLSKVEKLNSTGSLRYSFSVVDDEKKTVKRISVFKQDGTLVTAETVHLGASIDHQMHQEQHRDFLDALKIGSKE